MLLNLIQYADSREIKKWYLRCRSELSEQDYIENEQVLLEALKKKNLSAYYDICLEKGKTEEILEYIKQHINFWDWQRIDDKHRYGSFLPANVSLQSSIESVDLIKQSTIRYLDELEEEMSLLPGYQKPKIVETQKRTLKSQTDPDCGYINQKSKKGLGYLTEMTIDTANGIVTGVDCYAANHRESDLILNHLKKQKEVLGYAPVKLALDGGYDVGAVHRGLELLGVDGYTAIRTYQNNALKKGFEYDAENDCFVCKKDQILAFEKLVYKKGSMNYYRLYKRMRKDCIECERLSHCQIDQGSVRINASGNYPAFHRNKQKYKTSEYYRVMRLRKIWAEGTFAVLKREHKLNKIQKRGIGKATEECLLSAAALNLKRMVKAL